MKNELYSNLKFDLTRVQQKTNLFDFVNAILFNHSCKYLLWFRIGNFFRNSTIFKPIYIIALIYIRRLSHKYNMRIPIKTKICKGLLARFFSIVISEDSIIGNHVTIFNGVTIGTERGDTNSGYPIVGNEVVIATGAKIIGNIRIGNHVFVGANAVVAKDIPDNTVVVGILAKILNINGVEKTSFY